MGIQHAEAARDRLLRADGPDATVTDVCEAVIDALHGLVRFDWAAFMTTDHETMLPTGGVVEGFHPDTCAPFWDSELLDPDFIKFRDLAAQTDPIATLADATDGDLERSPRFTKLYRDIGVGDELRFAVCAGSDCIAVATLLRAESDGPVEASEIADVRVLLPTIARVLRRAMGRLGSQSTTETPPAVVLLDGGGQILSVTEGGRRMLEDLYTDGVEEDGVPTIVRAAATRARWSRRQSRLAHRVRGRSGQWMRLDVQPMEGDAEVVAITISPARAGDLFPILLASYGLTERESAVTMLLARGLSSREIAQELSISPHTVRDHTKVIYEKAEVSSRGELVAKLFADHVIESMHAAVHRV